MCGAPGSQATVPAGDQSQTSCLCHHSKATHSMSISKHFLAARSGIKVVLWGTAGTESLGENLRGAALCSYAAVFMSDLQELFSRRQKSLDQGDSGLTWPGAIPAAQIPTGNCPAAAAQSAAEASLNPGQNLHLLEVRCCCSHPCSKVCRCCCVQFLPQ